MKFYLAASLASVLLLGLAAAPPAGAVSGVKVHCAGLWYDLDTHEHEVDPVRFLETDCFAFAGVAATGQSLGVFVENECAPTGLVERTCEVRGCYYSFGLFPGCTEVFRQPYTLP